ncbi:hypothetical protein VE26_05185 [Devosia chinhatensis]|uniref:Uncharacterized protein n=1 Tax=Devosia chinhatensis TaxID=429727 RepID=A0A0F5FN70_9HYPH|nr:hypothetical protein VE26_05185 [Devosia chinhatensis]
MPSARRLSPALAGLVGALALSIPLSALADETQLVIQSANGDHAFTVEVVDTPESRARGLMFVEDLAPDAGMLFDFEAERLVSFWMKNTLIPLDMLFITADGTISNIHVNAVPHDETSIPSEGPVQYVLEIPGGRSVELGIEAGDTVTHPRID